MLPLMPKTEYLENLEARIRHNRKVVETVFLRLVREERSWQPKRSEWSVDQCFQHLVLYFETLAPRTAEALNTQEPAGTDGLFRPTWLAGKTMGKQFDPKTKGSTLKKYNPPAAYSQDILKRFLSQQNRLLGMVEQATEADLQAKCWPITRLPVRYNLGEFLNSFVAHDELHINQAQRVLAAYYYWLENGMGLTAVPEPG